MIHRRQRGASAAMILVVLAMLMVIAIGAALMSRLKDASAEESTTMARLTAAQNALEAYAASTQRLPCPADPTLDTGVEAPIDGIDCTSEAGTIPWKTIGMRRDDAIDPWGRKISYRVYHGANGFTQPGGVSMVACDTDEPSASSTAPGQLCNADADVTKRNTTPQKFLQGKGLKLTDMTAPQYKDVAYVILSYGETGLGGYTVSGAQLSLAGSSEERKNAQTGDYTIMAHSDYDTEANNSKHFDDLLVYRRIEDLVKRIGLGPRDWPEGPPPLGTTSIRFDQSSVSTAVGTSVATGADTGQATVDFAGKGSVSGVTGGSTPTDISLDTSASTDGLGVAGGASNMLDSASNESIQIRFFLGGRSLGLSLANIGTYVNGGATYAEIAQVNFYLNNAPVAGPYYAGCLDADGPRGDFSIDLGATIFNRVDITPMPAINVSTFARTGTSSFLVAEVKACDTGVACKTSLTDGSRPPPTCRIETVLP